jgi:ABC-type transport system involved in cytochrome c biogenesis ATPase subunit
MLSVQGLNQYYGGSHTLRDVGFDVPAGACTALLGRNGVGKTTLLKCLMGVLPVRSGKIGFAGTSIANLPPYARAALGIGYVPQGRDIFPRLSVQENLQMGLASKKSDARVPDFVFDMFPVLKQMLNRRGGDLSGGQQQQLAIGRALAMRPRLLSWTSRPKVSSRRSSRTSSAQSAASSPPGTSRFCWSSNTTISPNRSPIIMSSCRAGKSSPEAWARTWTATTCTRISPCNTQLPPGRSFAAMRVARSYVHLSYIIFRAAPISLECVMP